MNIARTTTKFATLSLLATLAACEVRVAGPPPPPPMGPVASLEIVDENGYHHHGYWDDHHAWHGGYYDAHHAYHDDPPDWRH
jgi:hypothetical protein